MKKTITASLLLLSLQAFAQMTPVGTWHTIDDETKKPRGEVTITDTNAATANTTAITTTVSSAIDINTTKPCNFSVSLGPCQIGRFNAVIQPWVIPAHWRVGHKVLVRVLEWFHLAHDLRVWGCTTSCHSRVVLSANGDGLEVSK